jgi:hypothetical protein
MQKTIEFFLVIKTLGGTKWELPYSALSFGEELNKDRTASFNIVRQVGNQVAEKTGVTLEFILSGGYREVEIYDQDATLVYSGFIDETTGNAGGDDMGNITVTSRGFFSLLEKRYTGANDFYDGIDAGAIAWDLIDTTQAKPYGDFGITQGVIDTSKDRQRTFKYNTIKEAIQGLTSDNVKEGFEFDIDVNKVFNVFYPEKGESRENVIFDSGLNIENWQVRKTGILGMANHVLVFGEGQGDAMIVVEEDADNSYKEPYFLLEYGLSDKDNGDTTLLSDKGKKYLDSFKYPQKFVNFDCFYTFPLFTTYQVGDWVRVRIPEEGIDDMLRITKKGTGMDGRVSISLRST